MSTLQEINSLDRPNEQEPQAKIIALAILAAVRTTFTGRQPVRVVPLTSAPIQTLVEPPDAPE